MLYKKTYVILALTIVAGLFSFSFTILCILDITELFNYANPDIPEFIGDDNTPADNLMTDEIATLGRVLFYDKQLSLNAQVSCASCHKQEFAFGDTSIVSLGFDGELTERHSPRLMNMSFNRVDSVFFDHRAASLEEQPLMTLANSIEMGFSGQNGQPSLDSLISRLNQLDYYQTLFDFAFGDAVATQDRVAKALSQFVRSIVSFDSKYDEGRALVNNASQDFPNFTAEENFGKSLFISPFPQIVDPLEVDPPPVMFFGCGNCHGNPTFSQRPNFRGNNGVLGVAGDTTCTDISVVRAPSIRNVMRPDGVENGPFMHDGSLANLREVLNHYTFVPYNPNNTNLSIGMGGNILQFDHRRPMSPEQEDALVAFMATLSGTDIYENPKWSNPFDENDELIIREFPCSATVAELTINAQHCEGDETLGYMAAGTYVDTLISSNGCDSIRTLILSVNAVYQQDLAVDICSGDSFLGYTEEGVYTAVLQSSLGCDSTIFLSLKVLDTYNDTLDVEICAGEEYDGYTTTGQYSNTFTSSEGCDSMTTLDLVVLPDTDPDCLPSFTQGPYGGTIKVFPNPVAEFLYVERTSTQAVYLEIYSLNGQKTFEQKITNSKSKLDLSELSSGIWIVNITDPISESSMSYRILKM